MNNIEDYPRVSEILEATAPERDRQSLQKAKQRRDKEFGLGSWDAHCQTRKHEGTILHWLVNTYYEYGAAAIDSALIPAAVAPYWQNLQPFLDSMQLRGAEPAGIEMQVASDRYKYRGRLDCRLFFPAASTFALFDFKTFQGYPLWNGEYQSVWQVFRKGSADWSGLMPKARNALLQAALYKIAADECGLPCDEVWIAVIPASEPVQLVPMAAEWWEMARDEAIARVEQFYKLLGK